MFLLRGQETGARLFSFLGYPLAKTIPNPRSKSQPWLTVKASREDHNSDNEYGTQYSILSCHIRCTRWAMILPAAAFLQPDLLGAPVQNTSEQATQDVLGDPFRGAWPTACERRWDCRAVQETRPPGMEPLDTPPLAR